MKKYKKTTRQYYRARPQRKQESSITVPIIVVYLQHDAEILIHLK